MKLWTCELPYQPAWLEVVTGAIMVWTYMKTYTFNEKKSGKEKKEKECVGDDECDHTVTQREAGREREEGLKAD